MSWITGFADKAEQILNKIDQSAADKLQKKKPTKAVQDTPLTEVTTEASPVLPRSRFTPPPSPAKPKLPSVKSVPSMVNQCHEEEKLIDFLNDNSKPSTESGGGKPEHVVVKAGGGEDVEGERQMLKNEVRVLNNELSLLLHRTRAAERESENLKAELKEAESSRANIQEELNRLAAQFKTLELQHEALTAENKRLEEEVGAGAHTESEVTQQLRQQVTALRDQQDALTQRLQVKQRECETLTTWRTQEKEAMNERVSALRTELEQYRARAQRTLSDKEALICQLRSSTGDSSLSDSYSTELSQLREERRLQVEEQQTTLAQLEAVRARLQDTEQTLEKVRDNAARAQLELQDRVTQENNKRRVIEDDFRVQTQELRLVREEAAGLRARLRERDTELSQLRSARPASPPSLLPGELETRLSSLTKTLIHKQTALETATTERNQLRMQLEELEHKHRENLLQLHQARIMSANDTDDAKAQVPSFMIESPFDTGVARRVKRAYSCLDTVSIRTGVFLRRYPLARILVIFYVVMLHMLVLMVLYSRTPDNAQK